MAIKASPIGATFSRPATPSVAAVTGPLADLRFLGDVLRFFGDVLRCFGDRVVNERPPFSGADIG